MVRYNHRSQDLQIHDFQALFCTLLDHSCASADFYHKYVPHIQQEKCILKGRRLRNERSKGSACGGEKRQRLKAQIKMRGQAVT